MAGEKLHDDKFASFKQCLDHVSSVRAPAQICDNDYSCCEALLQMKTLLSDEKMLLLSNKWSFLDKKNYELLFVDTLVYLAKRLDQKHQSSKPQQPLLVLDHILHILKQLTEYQLKIEAIFNFCIKLHEHELTYVLLSFFRGDKYSSLASASYDPHERLLIMLGIVLNMSENPYLTWRKAEVLDTLADYESPLAMAYKDLKDRVSKNLSHASLVEFLQDLSRVKNAAQIGQSEKVYADLFFLKYTIKSHSFNEEGLFLTTDFLHILVEFLEYTRFTLTEANFDSIQVEIQKPRAVTKDAYQRLFSIFYNMMVILNEIMFRLIFHIDYFLLSF